MQITDEMVQRAFGRIVGGNRVQPTPDGQWWIPTPTRDRVRAALEAVAPVIRAAVLEEAAGVALNRDVGDGYYIEIREAIAAAILAMKETT
jgi:hypothetical protein